jgi:hypothetical protein
LKGGIMLKESSVNERLCAIYGQNMYVISPQNGTFYG